MGSAPLRFVLLCNSLDLPAWQVRCLEEAIGEGVAELVGVVVRKGNDEPPSKSRWRKRWADRRLVLWRLFSRFYVEPSSKAVISQNVEDDMKSVPIFYDQPESVGRYSEALSESGIAFIGEARPDFILRFGFGILSGDVLNCAQYGVWSYHHGDPESFRGQPPGFWEIMNGAPSVGAVLQVLGSQLDAGKILHSGHFQITPQSYAKTRDTIYFGSAAWVRRMCADIIVNGWQASAPLGPDDYGPVYKQPNNIEMSRFIGKAILSFFQAQVKYKLYRQVWNCGVVPAPISEVAGLEGPEKQRGALVKVNWMPMTRGIFKADPFGFSLGRGTAIRILFELYDWASKRGEIAAVDYEDGNFGPLAKMMVAETHLSYPFVFTGDDGLLLIPENAESNGLSAIAITKGEALGESKTILSNFNQVDCTIVLSNGQYFMFSLDESVSKNTDLNIYYAEHVNGPWHAHPLNPVKSDIRSARPGGTPFVLNGKLYRPAQDCSTHYGAAVTINEVAVLSDREFSESAVRQVRPVEGGPFEYGLHTLSSVGNVTLIDGASKRSALTA